MAGKRPYLVCHDYGQGGAWAYVIADSEDKVRARYPDLRIFPEPPAFFTQQQLDSIAKSCTVDVDGEPTGWLAIPNQ